MSELDDFNKQFFSNQSDSSVGTVKPTTPVITTDVAEQEAFNKQFFVGETTTPSSIKSDVSTEETGITPMQKEIALQTMADKMGIQSLDFQRETDITTEQKADTSILDQASGFLFTNNFNNPLKSREQAIKNINTRKLEDEQRELETALPDDLDQNEIEDIFFAKDSEVVPDEGVLDLLTLATKTMFTSKPEDRLEIYKASAGANYIGSRKDDDGNIIIRLVTDEGTEKDYYIDRPNFDSKDKAGVLANIVADIPRIAGELVKFLPAAKAVRTVGTATATLPSVARVGAQAVTALGATLGTRAIENKLNDNELVDQEALLEGGIDATLEVALPVLGKAFRLAKELPIVTQGIDLARQGASNIKNLSVDGINKLLKSDIEVQNFFKDPKMSMADLSQNDRDLLTESLSKLDPNTKIKIDIGHPEQIPQFLDDELKSVKSFEMPAKPMIAKLKEKVKSDAILKKEFGKAINNDKALAGKFKDLVQDMTDKERSFFEGMLTESSSVLGKNFKNKSHLDRLKFGATNLNEAVWKKADADYKAVLKEFEVPEHVVTKLNNAKTLDEAQNILSFATEGQNVNAKDLLLKWERKVTAAEILTEEFDTVFREMPITKEFGDFFFDKNTKLGGDLSEMVGKMNKIDSNLGPTIAKQKLFNLLRPVGTETPLNYITRLKDSIDDDFLVKSMELYGETGKKDFVKILNNFRGMLEGETDQLLSDTGKGGLAQIANTLGKFARANPKTAALKFAWDMISGDQTQRGRNVLYHILSNTPTGDGGTDLLIKKIQQADGAVAFKKQFANLMSRALGRKLGHKTEEE